MLYVYMSLYMSLYVCPQCNEYEGNDTWFCGLQMSSSLCYIFKLGL